MPDLAGGKSLDLALEEVRPSFVAFLISFVVIAIAWAGHRDFFTLIRRTDRNLVWLNILYLLPVSVRPHLLYEPLTGRLKTVGVLIGAVPAAIYLLAILIADGAPLASLLIYCVVFRCSISSHSSWTARRRHVGRRRTRSPDPYDSSRVARISGRTRRYTVYARSRNPRIACTSSRLRRVRLATGSDTDLATRPRTPVRDALPIVTARSWTPIPRRLPRRELDETWLGSSPGRVRAEPS